MLPVYQHAAAVVCVCVCFVSCCTKRMIDCQVNTIPSSQAEHTLSHFYHYTGLKFLAFFLLPRRNNNAIFINRVVKGLN